LINAETRPWTYCIDLEEFGWFKSTQDKAKVPADKLFQYFEVGQRAECRVWSIACDMILYGSLYNTRTGPGPVQLTVLPL
jgi:hypothetical protein